MNKLSKDKLLALRKEYLNEILRLDTERKNHYKKINTLRYYRRNIHCMNRPWLDRYIPTINPKYGSYRNIEMKLNRINLLLKLTFWKEY